MTHSFPSHYLGQIYPMSPWECCWDAGGRGDFSGDKHKVPGAGGGAQHSRDRRDCVRTWLQHCWLRCSWAATSAREVRHFLFFCFSSEMICHYWYFMTECNLSALIWEINASMSTCLRNSTAEKIHSIRLPTENQREACIWVCSRRLQYRGQRGWRAGRDGCRIRKFSTIHTHIWC